MKRQTTAVRLLSVLAAAFLLLTGAGCAANAGGGPVVKETPAYEFEGWGKNPPAFDRGGGVDAMRSVAKDGTLELFIDDTSMDFAVKDSASGKVWYSSPFCDPSFTGDAEEGKRALVNLTVSRGGTLNTFNSFTHSVKDGRFAVRPTQGGVRIEMTIGQSRAITSLDLPQAVEKKRFETEILAKLPADQAAALQERYTLYDKDAPAVSERKLAAAMEKFPILKERALYILNTGIPDYAAETIKGYLDGIGYDETQIQKDNDDNRADVQVEEVLRYDVELQLRLENGQFLASLDCSRIPEDADTCVTGVTILEAFGASHQAADKGWLLLPDGSGSLQNIDGSGSTYSSYTVRIYGEEKAIRVEQKTGATEQAILPVFGENVNGAGFVAMIEEGDAVAGVTTNLKGILPFSSIYPTFTITETATVDAGFADAAASVGVPMVQPVPYRGRLTVRYAFASGDQAELYGLSQIVRARYQQLGLLPKEKRKTAPALNVRLLGSVDKPATLLGVIPVRKNMAATTFAQAGEIAAALHGAGVGPISMEYAGWSRGGMYAKNLLSLQVENVLGGEKDLKALNDTLVAAGDALYPQAALLSVADTRGFNMGKWAARALGNNLTTIYQYDTATGNRFDYRIGTYVAPSQIDAYVGGFAADYAKLGLPGLSVTDAGRELYSEMNKARGVNRQDAKNLVAKGLERLNDVELRMAAGNLYTLPYASFLTDMPLDSSRYNREMYAVPFTQMVLQGLVGYTGTPVNNNADYQEQLVRSAAFGAQLTFCFTYQPSDFLSGSYVVDYCSTDYRDWLEVAAAAYKRSADCLSKISDADMIGYEPVMEGVFRTAYDNGVAVVANYTPSPVAVDGVTVGAMDFAVIEGALD